MHGRSRSTRAIPVVPDHDPRRRVLRPTAAVTWVDAHHALVAHTTPTGTDVVEVRPPDGDCFCPTYLTRVVDEIGDRERVAILGPEAFRVMLEREYVAINRRPDRLLDVPGVAEEQSADLLARLRTLTTG